MGRNETATLGGGCFWCLEAVYQDLDGVRQVESGYMGGTTPDPSYRDVCSGATGHVEVVQLEFDADVVPYSEILDVFFTIHDPTTHDRQGSDVGTQYRSVIYYHSDQQRAAAEEKIREFDQAGIWPEPVVTEVRPASTFYKAEAYHQQYFVNNSQQPYCAYVIAPKLRKFRDKFTTKLRRHA